MHGSHFDTLVRVLASRRPRRAALPLLALLGLGLIGPGDAGAARSGKCRQKPGECERCDRGKCTRKHGEKQCKAGKIKPKAEGTLCAGGTCQSGVCVRAAATTTAPVIPPPPGCVPEPKATTCAAGCGDRLNNCNQPITCPCPTGQDCLSNGTCARPCSLLGDCDGCSDTACSAESTEGQRHCVVDLGGDNSACIPLQPCLTTSECPLGFQCQDCGPTTIRCIAVALCPPS